MKYHIQEVEYWPVYTPKLESEVYYYSDDERAFQRAYIAEMPTELFKRWQKAKAEFDQVQEEIHAAWIATK